VDVFGALADDVRRDLVRRLAENGPARVVDLAAVHPISRPAISRHLRVLQDAGLCAAEDRGRERHYRFDPAGLGVVRAWLYVVDEAHRPATPVTGDMLDALDLEVRRTVRDRRTGANVGEEETG